MVKQYPHQLITAGVTTNSTRDANGDFVQGVVDDTIIDTSCRYEPANREQVITNDEGKQLIYTGIIYLPLPAPDISFGTNLTVLNGGKELIKSTVKRYSPGQLNARIWV